MKTTSPAIAATGSIQRTNDRASAIGLHLAEQPLDLLERRVHALDLFEEDALSAQRLLGELLVVASAAVLETLVAVIEHEPDDRDDHAEEGDRDPISAHHVSRLRRFAERRRRSSWGPVSGRISSTRSTSWLSHPPRVRARRSRARPPRASRGACRAAAARGPAGARARSRGRARPRAPRGCGAGGGCRARRRWRAGGPGRASCQVLLPGVRETLHMNESCVDGAETTRA